MIHEAKDLLEAIEKFEISAEGDSDDKEHDSAVEMATAARTFLLKSAERKAGGGLGISAITLYEIAAMAAKGRIDLRASPQAFLGEVERRFVVKPITGEICAEATRLPDAYPRDPMDRLIGATAIVEGMKLITADEAIRRSHAVDTVW